MRRAQIVLLLLLLPLAVSTTASAWTRTSDERIAKKSAALAPPDLRTIIERFNGEYRHGIERAQSDEGSTAHHFFVLSREGQLREQIEKETRRAIQMIRTGEPMGAVAERLGILAHLVADANNPFHVANDDAKLTASHNDFEQYFERKLAKFPTVFYGLDPQFRLTAYLDRTFARTSKFYPLMSAEYFRNGERRTSADFDDRSTAFGVASVCYSRAVTDLVNLYYYIWKEAGGDVRTAAAMQRGNLMLNAW
jgi:hypothetical protein